MSYQITDKTTMVLLHTIGLRTRTEEDIRIRCSLPGSYEPKVGSDYILGQSWLIQSGVSEGIHFSDFSRVHMHLIDLLTNNIDGDGVGHTKDPELSGSYRLCWTQDPSLTIAAIPSALFEEELEEAVEQKEDISTHMSLKRVSEANFEDAVKVDESA